MANKIVSVWGGIVSSMLGLVSLTIIPISVMFNYMQLDEESLDLDKVEFSFILSPLIFCLFVLASIILGVYVLINKPDNKSAKVLSVVGLSLSGLSIFFYGQYILHVMNSFM